MQPNKLFIILFFFPFLLFSQNTPFIEVTDSQGRDDILVDCDYPVDADRCFVLEANYTIINETTSYSVNNIPFATLSGLTNETLVSIPRDDKWSGVLPLPFDFCYYDNGYSDLIIGDNGLVSFNTSLANADSPYLAATIPNGQMPTSAIFGAFHDLTNDTNVFGCTDDPATPENECGEIKTYVIGTAPQRAFVVSYENLNHFNCETSRSTTQIVLYETSNVIEVYVAEKPINCETDPVAAYRKNALIGIQNIDGTIATFPPDRNTSVWSATNEAWRFTPNGIPATVVEWTDENGDFVATGDQITVCPEQTTNYTATVTYDMCVGNDIVLEDTIDIAIDFSYPIAIDNEVIACDIDTIGEELVDLTAYEPLMVGTQTGLVLTYHTTLADAQADPNPMNPIANPAAYLLTNPTEVFYVRLQRGVGCFDVGTLTINLQELVTPQLTEIVLCDVGNDNSELVIFSNYTSQIVGGQAGVNVLYYKTQADVDNNNSITSLTAVNGDSVFVSLSLQPDSTCPNVVEIPIILLPTPVVEPIPVTLCSDIVVYDLTQHEAEVQANNTETLSFTYHLRRSWALNNINPFDPTDTNNPIDPELYVLNGVSQIWVRAFTDDGCVEVFPINFTYIDGVIVQDAIQVITGNIFNLISSINDMVTDLTGITVQYYNTLEGAQAQDPNDVILDPESYAITNPNAQVFVVFTNTASGCSNIGTIDLVTAGFGGDPINSNVQICDTDNDSQETITLSDYDAGLIAGFDNAEYMVVSYYLLETDATNDINEIAEITITAPTTIYARVSLVFDNVELAFMIYEINLDFQSTILLNPVTDTICDEFGNNREIHDITQYEDQISTVAGATFSYEYTNGTTIDDPTMFTVVGPTRVVNVFVTTPDGCTTETTITINFHPLIPATDTIIQGCDADNNNEELFNLDDALPNVNPDFANYLVSYHLNLDDAQNGDLPITNPNTYLVTANTSVFVRLYNTTTTCYATAEIDLEIVSVPEILSDTMTLCDFENDGIENNVDLTQFNSTILGTQTGVTLTYYETEADANAQMNPITTKDIANGTEVFINLSAPGSCILVGSITINLQTSPVVNDIDVIVCDNFTDGEERYDLTLSNSAIIADIANHSFRYYTLEENAINNTGAISSNYLITSVPQTLYVRVTSNATGCFSIAEMNLDFTFPTTIQDTELTACDNDFNLSEEFDLTTAIPNMLADTTGLDITYYSDEVGAQTANSSFLITTPQNHNTASETDTVFVRFDNPATGCFSIGKIVLKIVATPKLISGSFEICDTDFDGFYTLDLAHLNPTIIQDQTDLVFDYYTSFAEAETETNVISNTSNYAIPNDNHDVYIRVTNVFGCWSVARVTISIKESVTVETITNTLEACDDDLDGFSFFDLTTFENLFTTEVGATFRYYDTEMDANLQQNEITNPAVHQNVNPNTQTIYVRVSLQDKCDAITSFVISTINITPPIVTEATFCAGTSVVLDPGNQYETYSWSTTETTQTIEVSVAGTYSVTLTDSNGCTGTFNIEVVELPLPESFDISILECDYYEDADGFMQFNLTDYNNQLTGNNPNVTTHFFTSLADLEADMNEQNTLFTNTTNPQTLYVKVVDTTTGCFSTAELTLETSFIDPNPALLELCDELNSEDGLNTFDLSLANAQVTNGLPVNTAVVYYRTYNDAQLQQNPLNTTYNNTIPYAQIIYSRVENAEGCFGIDEVLLIVNNLPDVENEEVVYCLNTYPDTMELESGVTGNPSDYTYNWSTGETTATIQINEIGVYTVTITSAEGCEKSREITVVPSSTATIERIDIEDPIAINIATVYVSGEGDYEYALDDENGPYQDDNVFTNVSGGLHTVYVRDKNGCGIVSKRISAISVPNFFTPNNDGHNDFWIPKGFATEFQSNVLIYVFDRYGKLLKTLDPFTSSGWDGTYNNNPMLQNDYWYSIEFLENFSGRQRVLKGHFALIR